ncbi:DUF1254 domain-containing protein [Ferrimonas balearica]|uniref:DUF1254 domain-containing protein n=1 Tax=Ferrimonas balearica TaxID=44012 RepID=UPI001C993741|nr:DUF1254 domain-containing protein [Ferrimonas balearica]MBY5920192.1 DUF1254 domain-containing protein [Ferrimonas balearica]MBY5997123.1 DUF1254 domain-containing protein [Ferrimonas balearica]
MKASPCFISLFLLVTSAVMAEPRAYPPVPESITTPDTVQTRLGELRFDDGRPTPETVTALYDHLDFMRGVEVFLNFVPAASMEALRRGLADIGATRFNEAVLFEQLMDARPLFLTGNTDTVYASVFLDLERDGPTVVEVPPGAGPGTVNDAFFRFVIDMGRPGPDAGKGGHYLILPPDYQGTIEPSKDNKPVSVDGRDYFVAQSASYVNWVILRGMLVEGRAEPAVTMWREGLKVYPLSQVKSPPPMTFINGSERSFNTIHANNEHFFDEVNAVIQREPAELFSPHLLGLASAIGMQKGQPFEPDPRMAKLLKESAAVGNATARTIWLKPRAPEAFLYPDSGWYTGFVGGDYRWLIADGDGGRNLDARTLFFYAATVNTPAMALEIPGVGSQYAFSATDAKGAFLDGTMSYRLTLPAPVPAKNFWSVVVYDTQTRSELQTDQRFPSKNNVRDALNYNEDGSVDLYFGPTPPAQGESNWIQTTPDKGWFAVLRLYGPLEPWFEKTWRPGEFEVYKE